MPENAVFRSWLFSVKYYIKINIFGFGLNKTLNHLDFETFVPFLLFLDNLLNKQFIVKVICRLLIKIIISCSPNINT